MMTRTKQGTSTKGALPAQRFILKNRPWQLFGFGCYYAWFLCVIATSLLLPVEVNDTAHALVRLGAVGGLAVGYCLCLLLRASRPLASPAPRDSLVAGLAASLSTVGLVVAPLTLSAATMAMTGIVAVCSCGAGTALAYLMNAGGVYWSRGPAGLSLMQLTSSVAAALVFTLAVGLVPWPIRVVLICGLPTAGGIILARSYAIQGEDQLGAKQPTDSAAPPAGIKAQATSCIERRLCLSIVLLALSSGLAYGILAVLVSERLSTSFSIPGIVLLIIPTGVAFVAFRTATRRQLEFFLVGVYRVAELLIPLGMVACTVVVTVIPAQISDTSLALTAGMSVLLAGYILFDEFLWLMHTCLLKKSTLSMVQVVSRYEGIQWAALFIGSCVAVLPIVIAKGSFDPPPPAYLVVCLAACICAALVAVTLVLDAEAARTAVTRREKIAGMPTMRERCYEAVRRFGLSEREFDVLELLVRGRTNSFIGDELGITEGTVKIHARHIYEKTGVSGKQQLIDLIEAIEVPATEEGPRD